MRKIFEQLFSSMFSFDDEGTREEQQKTEQSPEQNNLVRTKGNSYQDFAVVTGSGYSENFEVCFDKLQADDVSFEEF